MRGTQVAENTRNYVRYLAKLWAPYRRPGLVFEVTQGEDVPLVWKKDEDGATLHAQKIAVSCYRNIFKFVRHDSSYLRLGFVRRQRAVSVVCHS